MEDGSKESPSTAQGAAGALTSDSDDLGNWGFGPCVVGSVPEVNGVGALEAREFVPTRHELSIIAQHWLKEVLDLKFEYF